MSGGTKDFFQRSVLTRSLPYLKQGSTLSIRSQLKTDVRIRSHWRDDGNLRFIQIRRVFDNDTEISHDRNHNLNAHIMLSRKEDKLTSLGRQDPHVSIYVLDKHGIKQSAPIKISSNKNKDSTMLLSPTPSTLKPEDRKEEGNSLTLDVPDKINIDCDLTGGGSIFVENKIEGDVQLKTVQGNISVQKLRGHNIDLEIASPEQMGRKDDERIARPSFIFVSDVLESQSLRLSASRSSLDRIRAKRIHTNTMEIRIGGDENALATSSPCKKEPLLDDDDSGAICDISSLYITGDASIEVRQPISIANESKQQSQAVRIKSHHGHVHIEASAPKHESSNDVSENFLPLVDLGGVNGSCEVWVSQPKSKNQKIGYISKNIDDKRTSCHVHFDSIAPDSVSLIHAEEGDIHVTVDRKVESDVRLLSPPSTHDIDVETLLLEDNKDGSMAEEVLHMLQEIEKSAALDKENHHSDSKSGNISIETQAFTSRKRVGSQKVQFYEFVDGWIENTTSEPDSRFDRKIRGSIGGGKINIDGAQNQALHGFGIENTKADEMGEGGFARPLLAVSSPDRIVLETLSWMGNIARRYGLNDKREEDDLGRQATRRKGLGRDIPTRG